MDVREKLVELLKEISYDRKLSWYDLWDMRDGAEDIADLLIAHGVTVQEDAGISDEILEQLRNAPVMAMTEEPNVEVVQDYKGVEIDPFNEWISVKDRLPQEKGEICKNVILFMDDGLVTVGWLNEDRGSAYMLDTRNDFISKVPMSRCTHWMPLPQPPKGE